MRPLLLLLFAATLAAQTETRFENRPALRLGNGALSLVVLPEGASLVSLTLDRDATQTNPMWNPIRMAKERSRPALSTNGFGHFICVDGFGPVSPEEQRAGLNGHGEAHRQPFAVSPLVRQGTRQRLEMRANLPLVMESLTRTLEMVDGEQVVYVTSQLENQLAFDRPINWAEHATIGAPFLEAGKTVVDVSVAQCQTRPHQMQPPNRTLASGQDFRYPQAPLLQGGTRDIRLVPNPPNSMDHIGCLVPENRAHAFITALHPEKQLLLGYLFRREEFPWVQEWLNFPADGALSRGLEFSTQPYDLPRRDMVSLGRMFGTPTFRWLPAKSRIASRFLLFWTQTPAGLRHVEDVRLEAGRIVIVGDGHRLELPATLGL